MHPQMRWAVELRGQSRSRDTFGPRTVGLGGAVPASEGGDVPASEGGTAEIRPRPCCPGEGMDKDGQGLWQSSNPGAKPSLLHGGGAHTEHTSHPG